MALESIDRVLIVGPMGAGKSYAAQHIAELIDKPVVNIDRIMLDPETGAPKDKERFLEDAEAYFSDPALADGWVADGTYRSLRPITWERADMIGYIRPSAAQNVLRLTQRSLCQDTAGGNSAASYVTWLKRLRASRTYDIEKLDTTTAEFKAAGTEVLVEKSSTALIAAFAIYLTAHNRP